MAAKGIWWSLLLPATVAAQAAPQGPEAVLPWLATPVVVDGDLAEWAGIPPGIVLNRPEQIPDESGRSAWAGVDDLSGEFWLAYDATHLYLAGVVRDDDLRARAAAPASDADRIELFLDLKTDERDPPALLDGDCRIVLSPWSESRQWAVLDRADEKAGPRQGGSALTGFRVASGMQGAGVHRFEAAIPFHHFPALQPGTARAGLQLALHDRDEARPGRRLTMTWNGAGPPTGGAAAMGWIRFRGPGPMVSPGSGSALLGRQLLLDLPFLLVPVVAVAVLLLLARAWTALRSRRPWLRPVVQVLGLLLFVAGFLLPGVWLDLREGRQQADLERKVTLLQQALRSMESGTLESYRGGSRDRALMDLLAGKPVARQKYTTYRFLSELAEGSFGPAPRHYPDEFFRVRPYWIPLPRNRPELFHFDPPLRGEALYVVVGRPFVPAPFGAGLVDAPRVRAALPSGVPGATPQAELLEFDEPFVPGGALGRELHEVSWRRLELRGEVRTLSLTAEQGGELRLVGLSLLPRKGDPVVPLCLGSASLGGVLTDLRAGWPQDAGLELGPGATAKVVLPPQPQGSVEPFQRVWLFYRAFYPGLPVANPGERVAEVIVQFRGTVPPRTITFEHQFSMFYQLVVHNTRDEPPEGSPAAVAFSWVDEAQERNINMVCPVTDLPAAEIESIEFRNLADYRISFRSVVFGSERAAAPQDPEDSPLVRDGQDRRLKDEVLAALRGATVAVYRDHRLSEATVGPEQRHEYAALPRGYQERSGGRPSWSVEDLPSGARRAAAYVPLLGDGWDGAVLGVFLTDDRWLAARVTASRSGLLGCLLGAPILLILFSELLSVFGSLRLRLMAVLSVASLVPLGVLSLVLAQVLERGHESDLRAGMRQQVQNALRQLEDQKERLRASARQWLHDLAYLYQARAASAPEEALAQHLPWTELKQQMVSQLPPEWRGGFLKLEFNAAPGSELAGQLAVAGDLRLAESETPARLDPGVYIHWGKVLIGVRSEEPVRGGSLSLTVGRPIGPELLGALAPGRSVLLTDARGYPLDCAGTGALDPQALLGHGRADPAVMAGREQAGFAALDRRQPVVLRERGGDVDWLSGCDVLRDLQDTPRALLVLSQPYQPATLDLAIGRIPVRAFFLLVAGLLIVLSAFLSFVVSGRISRPIEQLERGAQAISRGDLDTRVHADERGQIGRLTRTFNQMTQDLQARVQDLQLLNRATRDLGAQLDFDHTLATLRRFCEQHSPADRVRIALFEPETARLELHGGPEVRRLEMTPQLQFLAQVGGAFSLWVRAGAGHPLLAELPGIHSVLGLPISYAGRCRGAVLLSFERSTPLPVNLELLTTLAAQASVALENALLYRHVVQDPQTAAFLPDYFRRRTAEEVGLAQPRGRPLALIGLWLGDGHRLPSRLEAFAAVLREHLPPAAVLCHAGMGQFQILVPGADRPAAEALVGRLLEAWHAAELRTSPRQREGRRPMGALVVFPEEAASAEFLFEALRNRLAAGSAVESAALEFDESLQRDGVTAVSPAMREVYRTLRRIAPTDLTVLLEGETGTGKEVLTNLIHRWSKRAAGPLVKVHCAALSESLLVSELFGHEKGAFTGADRRRVGKFEQANGGTIFLDEVGDMPMDVQVKLLRVLQEREIDRVGGSGPVAVDVRVIAATNHDIRSMVEAGRFREDLYYRLQGVVVQVPPLRERRQEIAALVEHFRSEVVSAGQSRVKSFSTDAMDELFLRPWPGNVRELRNVVFRAMVLATGEQVELRDLRAVLPPVERPPGEALPVARPLAPPPEAAPAAAPAAAPTGSAADPRSSYELPRPGAIDVPVPGVPEVAASPHDELPDRIRALFELVCQRGEIRTQDHMARNKVSHRTGLRDLQTLVDLGLIERLGKRRGARYRPRVRSDIHPNGGQFNPPALADSGIELGLNKAGHQ